MGSRNKHAGLPAEARTGLMRAWLAILEKRHPDILWLPERARTSQPERAQTAHFGYGEGLTSVTDTHSFTVAPSTERD